MKMFGYHCIVKKAEDLNKNVEGALKYLAPLGLTHLVLELDNSFLSKSHPEIASSDVTGEALKAACDRLRDGGIEPIPLYNCVGHQGWNTRNSLLKAYPEFDEAPHIPDDKLVAKVHEREGDLWLSTYTPAWCSNEPKIFDVVFPVLDEMVEASGAKILHIGMDEIFLYGQCPRCRGMKPSDLFRDQLLKFYDHFKAKGVDIAIWGDRLLDANKLIGEDGPRRARYEKDFENVGTSLCIDELPKDILICDWHYGKEDSYPSARELLSHGYSSWPSTWYRAEGAEAFWSASLEVAKELGLYSSLPGMLVTGWGIRNVKELFEAPKDQLDERESQIVNTLPLVAERMKSYFNES